MGMKRTSPFSVSFPNWFGNLEPRENLFCHGPDTRLSKVICTDFVQFGVQLETDQNDEIAF